MCDTVVVVRPEGVLFAKNSDRNANEAQPLQWVPRQQHPAGAALRCSWIEIPQVAETNAVLLSRPFWMWGAEMGANEHGVTIGNEAVFTRQPCAKLGLNGMDLLRLALERATSAAEAVEVITALLAEHGQGGGGNLEDRGFLNHNSYIVADPGEAIVLETAGAEWTTESVRGARSISNGLTIPGFAEQHSDTIKTWASDCRVRQPRTQALAGHVDGVAAMAALLRDHGAEAQVPRYSWLTGGLTAPCVHAGGVAVDSQTTASWIADLRPGAIQHWVTGTAAPCTSLFKPVDLTRPIAGIGEPTETADDASLWWRHEQLHRRALTDPARLLPRFATERDEVERSWFAAPPEPAEAFADGERLLAKWTEAVSDRSVVDTRPLIARRYWRKRNRLAGIDLR